MHEGLPPVSLDVSTARVRPVSRRLGESIILKYEWLGTLGAGTQRCYGIFFGAYCAGVTTFANAGAIPAMMKTFRLDSTQLSYLARGACVHWAPPNTNSKLIAHSCRFERERGAQLVIAFVDSDAGEVGTIYQACGWIYVGRGASTWFQWVSPLGRVWSSNSATKRCSMKGIKLAVLERELVRAGWRKQLANAKGRYVCVLDRANAALVARVEHMRQPYPKRGRSVDGGTADLPISREQFDSDSPALLSDH
jgi:hypothetical protein